jgi:hypothetical protein
VESIWHRNFSGRSITPFGHHENGMSDVELDLRGRQVPIAIFSGARRVKKP